MNTLFFFESFVINSLNVCFETSNQNNNKRSTTAMDISANSSNFTIVSHFQKLTRTIHDKRAKNEPITAELQCLQDSINHKNPKICENAVAALAATSETGFVLNSLISSLSKLKSSDGNYEILVDGLFRVLLEDVASAGYKCQFDVHRKVHPVIFLIDESRMVYLAVKINAVLRSRNR